VLRALPIRQPQGLVVLSTTDERGTRLQFIYERTLEALNARPHVFDAVAMYSGGGLLPIEARGVVAEGGVEGVTLDYFAMVGVRPTVGRLIGASDTPTADTAAPVVVLGHRFWQRYF